MNNPMAYALPVGTQLIYKFGKQYWADSSFHEPPVKSELFFSEKCYLYRGTDGSTKPFKTLK